MLRAGYAGPNPLVVAGLDEVNITRLKNDQPIAVPLSDFSPGMKGKLIIFYGNNSGDLEKTMGEFVGPHTKTFSDPRLEQEEAARRDHKHILICTMGLPKSGKTTWARAQAWPIVNPDSIRLAIHGQRFIASAEPFVWATAKAMVYALFLAGHQTVILDATNITKKRRLEWWDDRWTTFWKVFDTPQDECVRRAIDSKDLEIVNVIDRMAQQFEPLDDLAKRW